MSTNIIEKYYQNSIAIPQRFSATETHLPIGDIDFVILNLPKDTDISNILRTLTKLFLKIKNDF
ncbi:hypothetical protein TRFO_13680 [Tritrichomonas foetus]|uniref:Polymerase nucleotidyl transferase domain-containing protein n=1 Tax=Tritrichomonas foetus TaxID=1144522 RepID=A0A1J4JCV0_9EUKA|nr:hypothetical protein TRFO_38699 [Tritrichomonas foetus]OHS97653.1 hypothetical protein TRFO_09366 [Tritrichomonas foetus]OHT00467.1 hypothetical protein TRFO_32819 [Tritrichomonas foetus]OHT00916.1 hypothetical protein TRFO_32237 [Tritrichomonas foetus]OHT15855.1 hypothetical protein TRFO_13680 [Tritrichomonas foetus]|eukprot:OHS95100.1 hypothetical protein TRFO_38699 [Tritrichomonas foetus]